MANDLIIEKKRIFVGRINAFPNGKHMSIHAPNKVSGRACGREAAAARAPFKANCFQVLGEQDSGSASHLQPRA